MSLRNIRAFKLFGMVSLLMPELLLSAAEAAGSGEVPMDPPSDLPPPGPGQQWVPDAAREGWMLVNSPLEVLRAACPLLVLDHRLPSWDQPSHFLDSSPPVVHLNLPPRMSLHETRLIESRRARLEAKHKREREKRKAAAAVRARREGCKENKRKEKAQKKAKRDSRRKNR